VRDLVVASSSFPPVKRWAGVIGVPAVVGAIAVVGCAADDAVRAEIVAYAEGDWACALALPYDDVAGSSGQTMDVAATVEADDDSSGNVTFSIGGAGLEGMPPFTGTWRLDGTDLEVEIPDELTTSYAMDGVDLDTERIDILEDADGAEVQVVDVARDGDTVEFGWVDPWTGDDTSMRCTKA
jgi:hypothetical protein